MRARRKLVLPARLQDREHLVAGAEHGRADRDLGLAVRMTEISREPSGSSSSDTLLPIDGRPALDLHLDDLEALAPQLEQADEPVLRHLVLDQAEDARGRADRLRRSRAGRSAAGCAGR